MLQKRKEKTSPPYWTLYIFGSDTKMYELCFVYSLHFWVKKILSESGTVNGKVNSPKTGGGAKSFTFKELASATRNFREVNLLGEGGFGRVYKGRLDSGQVRSSTPLKINLFFFHKIFDVTLSSSTRWWLLSNWIQMGFKGTENS